MTKFEKEISAENWFWHNSILNNFIKFIRYYPLIVQVASTREREKIDDADDLTLHN